MHLPRTGSNEAPHIMAGTADWAGHDEILARSYKPGDIWLGVHQMPTEEAATLIDRLEAFEVALLGDESLDLAWREEQLAVSRDYREQLGRTDEVEIGVGDDRHLVTQGGSRGGKGTTAIVTNLCLYPGSVICIDPKGENTRLCRNRRGHGSEFCKGMGQTVVVIDPYEVSGVPLEERGSWNPLDAIDPGDRQVVDRAAGFADMLFIRTNSEDAHFDETARIFVKALILFVAYEYVGRADRNLLTVYSLLMNGAVDQLTADRPPAAEADIDPFDYLLELMRDDPGRADGVIAGAANMLIGMGDRERGSVLSTARRNLEFLERRSIRDALSHSTFDLDAIKTDPDGMTIFLCLPPQRMHDTSRFLRLMIGAALERMYEIKLPPTTGHPVLFLLEEFATLRHMEIIEHAAGYAAGFGVKLWVILQDITQLKRYYRESWETFLGNAGVIQAFANSDYATLEYLSKKMGQTEISQMARNVNTTLTATTNDASIGQKVRESMSLKGMVSTLFSGEAKGQSASTSASDSQQIKLTALIQPDEIERAFRREEMTQIVLIKGERPFAISRQNYFDGSRFLGLFDPDREPFLNLDEAESLAESRRNDHAGWISELLNQADKWMAETVTQIDQAKRARGKRPQRPRPRS